MQTFQQRYQQCIKIAQKYKQQSGNNYDTDIDFLLTLKKDIQNISSQNIIAYALFFQNSTQYIEFSKLYEQIRRFMLYCNTFTKFVKVLHAKHNLSTMSYVINQENLPKQFGACLVLNLDKGKSIDLISNSFWGQYVFDHVYPTERVLQLLKDQNPLPYAINCRNIFINASIKCKEFKCPKQFYDYLMGKYIPTDQFTLWYYVHLLQQFYLLASSPAKFQNIKRRILGKEAYAQELEEEREVQDLLKQIVRNRKKKLDLSEIETQAEDIVKKKKAPHIEKIEKKTAEESIEQLLLGSRYMPKSAKKRLINLLLEIPTDEEDVKDSKSEIEEIKEEKPKKKSIAQKKLFKKLTSNKVGLKEFEKWMQSQSRQELQKCNTHMAFRAEHKFNNKADEELFFNKYQALIATLSTLNESHQ